LPQKVATAIANSPSAAEQILKLLQEVDSGNASAMVGTIRAEGGKVVVAHSIVTQTFQM
jgi:filamentous hemagglutinin family protein